MTWISPVASNITGRFLHPHFARLVQEIARKPFERNELIDSFNGNMSSLNNQIKNEIAELGMERSEWLKFDYHMNWGGRYLKKGNSKRARLHFKNLKFLELSLQWKLKYLLSYFPSKLTVILMNLVLYLRRK